MLQLHLLELQLVLFVKGVLVGVVYDVTMLKDNWASESGVQGYEYVGLCPQWSNAKYAESFFLWGYIDYSRAQSRLRENNSDTRRRSALSYQIKARWTCLDMLYARPVSTAGLLSM